MPLVTGDVDFHHVVEVVWDVFLLSEVITFPFFINTYLGVGCEPKL